MSQDTETCAKCGELCGYDDNKGNWLWDTDLAICGRCKCNLINHFNAFFGLENTFYDKDGMIIEWPDINRILLNIKRDDTKRVAYVITDKDYYTRIKEELVLIDTE